jgi:hypothetical protein
MAEEGTSAAASLNETVANLHLDEVTGEKVSKSELKKRQKLRLKEVEKKKKEAAAPPKAATAKKSNAEADEKELNPNVCLTIAQIISAIQELGSLKLCQRMRTGTDSPRVFIAIFRDPVTQHQQAHTNSGANSIPPQVPPQL